MGGGRRGWDRTGFFFFSCLGISLVLTVHLSYEKPWAGGSLTLLFSISLVVVLFHNMAMEDLQLGQIYSLSSCQPRQRARNSALYSKMHRTLHFWEKNQACLRVRVHTLFSDSYRLTEQDEHPRCFKKKKKKKREFWISIAETALLHQDHHGLHIHTHWDSLGTLSKLGKNLSWVLPYMLKSIPVTPGTLQTSHTHSCTRVCVHSARLQTDLSQCCSL